MYQPRPPIYSYIRVPPTTLLNKVPNTSPPITLRLRVPPAGQEEPSGDILLERGRVHCVAVSPLVHRASAAKAAVQEGPAMIEVDHQGEIRVLGVDGGPLAVVSKLVDHRVLSFRIRFRRVRRTVRVVVSRA